MYIRNSYLQSSPTALVSPHRLRDHNDATTEFMLGVNRAQLRQENGLTRGLDFGGALAQQLGSSLSSMGATQYQNTLNTALDSGKITQNQFNKGMNNLSVNDLFGNATNTFGNAYGASSGGAGHFMGGMMGNSLGGLAGSLFALGGSPYQMGEAEGGEVLEYDNGMMEEVQGPSHEQGGIPIDTQNIANIYSNRVKIDGVSIADRNKRRLKKIASLEDLMYRDPYNTLVQKSWERGKRNQEQLKMQELQLQQLINSLI